MLMYLQLISLSLTPHPLALHDILPQNLSDALRVFEGLCGIRGAGLEVGGVVEGFPRVSAGGDEGGCVVCKLQC